MQDHQTHRRRAGRPCMAALLLGTPTGAERRTYQAGGEVVGYYAGWAAYQGFTPDQIPAEHLTQINYAFARIDPDTLTIALENEAHDKKNLAALRKLRQQHPHLKLLISVGGWSDSKYFSDAAATAARRERFAASCVDFVVEQGLDGVDLDWEYPVSGGAAGTIHRPADKQNFTKLLQELRTQLDRQGRRDGKDYSLTIAGAAGSWYLNQIEAVKVADIVDHIFLMGYDLHGPWDTYADFNAPLYTPSGASPQRKAAVRRQRAGLSGQGHPGGEDRPGHAPVRLRLPGGQQSEATACTAPTPPPSPSATNAEKELSEQCRLPAAPPRGGPGAVSLRQPDLRLL